MDILIYILSIAVAAMSIISVPVFIWMLIMGIRGFFRQKELPKSPGNLNTFAVLICARNEEAVIANLLDSLNKQDYAGKYYMYVVADNCDDNTAGVARKHGATVFERFDKKNIGKGFALKYGIESIKRHATEHARHIDAFCVFDADNLAQASFLTEMDIALSNGAHMATGYRDTKNVHDSWVTEVYALYWLMLTRCYYKPRFTVGLPSMVSGTGFAFLADILEEGGWQTYSVTEDCEFSIQQILKGHNIIIADRAIFYDEQPRDYKASATQRARWMTGGLQCLRLYAAKAIKAVFSGVPQALDILWYLLMIVTSGLAVPLNVCVAVLLFLQPETRPYAPLILGVLGAGAYMFGCAIIYIALKLEKRDTKALARAILLYPAFMVNMSFVALGAMFKPSLTWEPIRHDNLKTIDEFEN